MSRPINTLTCKHFCSEFSIQLFEFFGRMININNYFYRNFTTVSYDLTCNENCDCDRNKFSPICGSDSLTYYSSCYAGCRGSHIENGKTQFFDCDCIDKCKLNNGKKKIALQLSVI